MYVISELLTNNLLTYLQTYLRTT